MEYFLNSILPTAFMGTAMIFTCFTLSALYARRRSYLFLGGILMSAMSLMVLSSLGNLFFGSIWLFQANLYMGLVVMCGFVLFDTQLIIEKAENGDKDYIWHCVDLFLDFVTLFRKLMMILAMNEKVSQPTPHRWKDGFWSASVYASDLPCYSDTHYSVMQANEQEVNQKLQLMEKKEQVKASCLPFFFLN
ncbi:PREDICTED: bax inhibitor 1-like [Dipodomys ordii]|uniref:Bax inhibitor 1-like n=1 Tax=Dipodomys ordii TaxID=10020 RepID=A0A1S3GV75_DIPOR|nr:PREDICTED: bax inhibitor 1-like [Dipodomys ordii]